MKKDSILINFENKALNLDLPIYVQNNRYYLPISEILKKIEGKVSIRNGIINIQWKDDDIVIDTSNNKFIANKKQYSLKKKIITQDNVVYASMIDFARFLDLKTYWDIQNKTICFYKNREETVKPLEQVGSKAALIRLEDITAGGLYSSKESLEKLRIISDYLYKQSIPFHIAWVPRYIKPSESIDNDISETYSMYNADFLFTLDYFMEKGGIMGLHGYTHQYGNTTSIDGLEFHRSKNDNIPGDKAYSKERVDKALNSAKKLDIECNFFETPHYGILKNQLSIIEEKFNYIYQPYSEDGGITSCENIYEVNNNEKKAIYIPTPLDYVDGKKDCDNMIHKIRKLSRNLLGSFFYHPYIEFEDIKVYRGGDGYPYYNYSEDSVLHKLVKEFKNKEYKFYRINDVKCYY
ncbi:DUF2334 domain-containing protein [Clostridium muellerianum]|nr:DUF2334 domain-containing protein [Clostridium muellerianum]